MTTIIISGVTCAGKSHLIKCLQDAGIERIVTVTTRTIRPGEVNGADYHFVSQDEFDHLQDTGQFLEFNRFGKACYATPLQALATDRVKAIVVDPNGHRAIKRALKKKGLPYLSVFLDADCATQAARFLSRCGQSQDTEQMTARLTAMLSVEAHWRDVARCLESPYDMLVPRFEADTEQKVLAEVIRRAQEAA